MSRVVPPAVRNLLVALAVAACLTVAHALEISRITVRTRTGVPFPRERLLNAIESRVGGTFDPVVLSRDIERLYEANLVTDVETEVEQLDEQTVALHFTVEPVPRIAEVVIEGNTHIRTRTLRGKITVSAGEPVDRAEIAHSALLIREQYEQKGYHGTTVTVHEQPIPDTARADIVFQVNEAGRYKVRSVEFVGNRAFGDRQLRKQMRTKATFWGRLLLPVGFLNPQVLEEDRLLLRQFYASHGYLDFRVLDIETRYLDDRPWVRIVVHIEEGSPYTVNAVHVEGNQRFGDGEIDDVLSMRPGDTYSSIREADDVRAIQNMYRPLGYLDLQLRADLDKDPQARTVDVTYMIVEGRPSRVRNIYIVGNEVTKDQVIRRELRIHPGDLADQNRIAQSESVLRNLGYFSAVNVMPQSTPEDDLRDLVVDVTEQRTGQLMIGAGISSEEAVVGVLEVAQRNFDWRNWPTFTGGGQRMRLRLQVGTERDEYLVSFVEPWWMGRQLRLELDALHMTRIEDTHKRQTTGASMTVSRRWRSIWRPSVGYRINQIRLYDFDDDVSTILADEEGTYTVSALVLGISRDTRDSFIHPTRGSHVSLTTELQPEFMGSYSNIYKLRLQATKYFPIIDRTVLRLRGELGVVDDISGDPVGIFDRFFAGGSSTLRGFERREVSPVDENEDSLGGKSLLLGSVELIYAITDNIRASVFSDSGNVWTDAYNWDPADVSVSVGVGLELRLPIGPVRIDYGLPVVTTRDHLDDSGRFHFMLGYFF